MKQPKMKSYVRSDLRPIRARFRRGHTLVELMIGISISTMLVIGLASVLGISVRTFKLHEGGAAKQTESTRLITTIANDLELAQNAPQQNSKSFVLAVPDRDGDQNPDYIQYQFLPAQSVVERRLFYSSNPALSQPAVIAHDVSQFQFNYYSKLEGTAYSDQDFIGNEQLLISHDEYPPPRNHKTVLMVVQSYWLTPEEIARRSMLESMGFYVTTVRQSISYGLFRWLAPYYHVAYVPCTVDPSILGSKLKWNKSGVVNEHIILAKTFGIGDSDGSSQSLSLLAIDEPYHFIPPNKVSGALDLFKTKQPVSTLSGDASEHAPGLKTIGKWKTRHAFSYLNRHDELYMTSQGDSGEFGFDEVFPTPVTSLDKLHLATRVTLTEGAKINSITAYSRTLGNANLRYAIYSDNNGEPDKRLAQTTSLNFSSENSGSWKTIPLTQPTTLPPGDYWLAIGTQTNVVFRYKLFNGKTRIANSGADPANAMMQYWTGDISLPVENLKVSIYANYVETDLAAGRRVQLPWGTANFDINELNEDGRQLFKNAIEWAADLDPEDNSEDFAINDTDFVAQLFLPNLPINATAWQITRVVAAVSPNEDHPTGKLKFALRKAGLTQNLTTLMQETPWIDTSQISDSGNQWFEIPFEQTDKLGPTQAVALVIKGNSSTADANLKVDVASSAMSLNTHLLRSSDAGASWSIAVPDADLRFYVFGRVYTSGE